MIIEAHTNAFTIKTSKLGELCIREEADGDVLIFRLHKRDMPITLHSIEDGGSYKSADQYNTSEIRLRH